MVHRAHKGSGRSLAQVTLEVVEENMGKPAPRLSAVKPPSEKKLTQKQLRKQAKREKAKAFKDRARKKPAKKKARSPMAPAYGSHWND